MLDRDIQRKINDSEQEIIVLNNLLIQARKRYHSLKKIHQRHTWLDWIYEKLGW